jgi:hypothetical protein
MATEVINSNVTSIFLGTTTINNPFLIMEVDGVVVPGNYITQISGTSRQYIFPRYQAGSIYITCVNIVYGAALPSIVRNIKVYISEAA